MKETIEKQILEWQQEIINQRQYILRLEGGVQAYQLLLQEINKEQPIKENVKKHEEKINTKTRSSIETSQCTSHKISVSKNEETNGARHEFYKGT